MLDKLKDYLKTIKSKQLHSLDFIIIYAFIFVFIHNISNINNKMIAINGLDFFAKLSIICADSIVAFGIITILLFIFSISHHLLKGFSLLILLLSGVFFYFIVNYSLVIDEFLISAIFEEELKDAPADVVSFGSIIAVFILAIIPTFYTLFYIKIQPIQFNKEYLKIYTTKFITYAFIVLMLLATSYKIKPENFLNDRITKTSLASFMPFNYIASTYLYFFDLRADYNVVLEDITKSNQFTYNANKFDNQPIKIILIIGESARGDKQSLNGYPLDTNPNLSKLKDLISYSNVQSCGTNSRYSITCLLSKEDRESFKFPYDKSNIFSVFNSLGFNTSFLSTQTLYEQSSESGKINLINVAIKDAKTKILLNTIRAQTPYEGNIYDEYLIPFMQKIFDNNKQNNFMVLYLSGSHVPYHNKSPEKFKKFNCSNYGNCKDSQNTLLADYDNSILYTDYVISQIIETFKDGNTLIYYISDHAENLGENGRYAHGNLWDEINNPYLIHVPQFIWLSNNMKAKLQNEYNNMLSKKNKKINQDYVFHSLLDCIGVSSNIINKKLSLCR